MSNSPTPGDVVIMKDVETVIEIKEVPLEQPKASEGIFSIKDQYGEIHLLEKRETENSWFVIIPAI